MANSAEQHQNYSISRKERRKYILIVLTIVIGAPTLLAVVIYLARFAMGAYYIPSAGMSPTLQVGDHIRVNRFAYWGAEPLRGDVVVFTAPPTASVNESQFVKRVVAVAGDTVRITPGYVTVDEKPIDHRALCHILSPNIREVVFVTITDDDVTVGDRHFGKEEIAAALNEPNASVKLVPGKVFINDKALNESYVSEDPDIGYPNASTPAHLIVKESGKQVVKMPPDSLFVMGDNRNDSNDSRYWGPLESRRVIGKVISILHPLDRKGAVK